jgi:hypothetical protein
MAIPPGECLWRDDHIAYHCRPDEGLTSMEIAPRTTPIVRVLDDRFAVLHRHESVTRGTSEGREQAFAVQRIEVLSRDGGRWRTCPDREPPPVRLPRVDGGLFTP